MRFGGHLEGFIFSSLNERHRARHRVVLRHGITGPSFFAYEEDALVAGRHSRAAKVARTSGPPKIRLTTGGARHAWGRSCGV